MSRVLLTTHLLKSSPSFLSYYTSRSVCASLLLYKGLSSAGLLLTGYAAVLTAVPVGAVRHALKKRNAWPALFLMSSAILISNVAVLKGAYM